MTAEPDPFATQLLEVLARQRGAVDLLLQARSIVERPCECENPERNCYRGRDARLHCSQCDGLWPSEERF